VDGMGYCIFRLHMEYGMLVFSCQADDIVATIEEGISWRENAMFVTNIAIYHRFSEKSLGAHGHTSPSSPKKKTPPVVGPSFVH